MVNAHLWDPLASNNNLAPPDGAPENTTLLSDVNDIIRENMGAVARMVRDTNGSLVSAGAGNAYALTTNNGFEDFDNILQLSFRADRANTPGAATLIVDGLPPRPLRAEIGVELDANAILENGIVTVAYTPLLDFFHYLNPPLGPPAGSVVAWFTEQLPNGWLECNGAAISRADHPRLFAVLGIRYGDGNGFTTFNLPDLRGEFLRGHDAGAGTDPNAATRTNRGDGTQGNNVGTRQADQLRIHQHGASGLSIGEAGSHDHQLNVRSWPVDPNASASDGDRLSRGATGGGTGNDRDAIGNDGNHTHPISGQTAASGGSETRPRNVATKWIIKT